MKFRIAQTDTIKVEAYLDSKEVVSIEQSGFRSLNSIDNKLLKIIGEPKENIKVKVWNTTKNYFKEYILDVNS